MVKQNELSFQCLIDQIQFQKLIQVVTIDQMPDQT